MKRSCLISAVVTLAILVSLGIVLLANAQNTVASVYCAANIRGIHQGMVLFAQNNNDQCPLPSVLDKAGHTIALAPGQDPTTKDTTANIMSILIYATYFGPETCVSPAENNARITMHQGYRYGKNLSGGEPSYPTGVVTPELALWDPSFSADFTAPGGSHFSYAHMMPSGPRLKTWKFTSSATEAVLGDRGPQFSSAVKGSAPNVTPTYDMKSNTLGYHSVRKRWNGHVAFNDHHVSHESTMWGEDNGKPIAYSDVSGTGWHDFFHFDEPDDASGLNNFLGIYTQAGPTPAAFKTIWD